MMLSQRVPNVAGILAIENSSFGYITRETHRWGGELGKIQGYDRVDEDSQLPPRSDPFDELWIRSWRDRARYVGPELLGEEGPEALMRLPMVMEDVFEEWGDVQPRPQFKVENLVQHGIDDSLTAAAEATAERLGLDEAETEALVDRYLGYTRELEGPDARPVPPVMFQLAAFSRDHSREVYEEVVIPMFEAMDPAPKTSLTQYGLGTHGYKDGEYVEGVDYGIAPAVFEHWHAAITGGFFDGDPR